MDDIEFDGKKIPEKASNTKENANEGATKSKQELDKTCGSPEMPSPDEKASESLARKKETESAIQGMHK